MCAAKKVEHLAVEVSSGVLGWVFCIEMVNAIRAGHEMGPLSRADYDAGVAHCNKIGRCAVMALHREAFWKSFSAMVAAGQAHKADATSV